MTVSSRCRRGPVDGCRLSGLNRLDLLGIVDPVHEQLISDRQQHGTEKQADDPACNHAAKSADDNDRHGRIDATSEQQRLQDVVGHTGQ